MKLAVLIPCYNEELTIGKVAADIKKILPDACVYVFDNNSDDGTAEIAKQSGAIVMKEKRGARASSSSRCSTKLMLISI